MNRRLLCISTYPRNDASFRQRVLCYVPYLRSRGWVVRTHSIASPWVYRNKNAGGWRRLGVMWLMVWGLAGRVALILGARRNDVVWVHREAFPFFTPLGERILARITGGRVVFDLDDAVYEKARSDWRSVFRDPARYRFALRTAVAATVGSPNLARFADDCGVSPHLVPTCVDTSRLRPRKPADRPTLPVVGWIGSWSTAHDLKMIGEVLADLKQQVLFEFLVIGPRNCGDFLPADLDYRWREWNEGDEAELLAGLDVGLMPLTDTSWNRGKCAYKVIQYMSVGVPFVASPVGMNVDVATASEAGVLADGPEQWHRQLLRLLTDGELRRASGERGREYAVAHFDFRTYAPEIELLLGAAAQKGKEVHE